MNLNDSMGRAEEIAKTRYDFNQLRVRLGSHGRPVPRSTAREVSKRIDRMRIGLKWYYTEDAVKRYEFRKTLLGR